MWIRRTLLLLACGQLLFAILACCTAVDQSGLVPGQLPPPTPADSPILGADYAGTLTAPRTATEELAGGVARQHLTLAFGGGFAANGRFGITGFYRNAWSRSASLVGVTTDEADVPSKPAHVLMAGVDFTVVDELRYRVGGRAFLGMVIAPTWFGSPREEQNAMNGLFAVGPYVTAVVTQRFRIDFGAYFSSYAYLPSTTCDGGSQMRADGLGATFTVDASVRIMQRLEWTVGISAPWNGGPIQHGPTLRSGFRLRIGRETSSNALLL